MICAVQCNKVLSRNCWSIYHQHISKRVGWICNHNTDTVLVCHFIKVISKVLIDSNVLAKKTSSIISSKWKTGEEENNISSSKSLFGRSEEQNILMKRHDPLPTTHILKRTILQFSLQCNEFLLTTRNIMEH